MANNIMVIAKNHPGSILVTLGGLGILGQIEGAGILVLAGIGLEIVLAIIKKG